MILIIGGEMQGKFAFAERAYPEYRKINGLHKRVWQWIQEGKQVPKEPERFWNEILREEPEALEEIRTAEKPGALEEIGTVEKPGTIEEIGSVEKLVVISNEVGYGIVPMDAKEREYREQVGRLHQFLAQQAHEVYRVVAGIPMKIK